MAGPNRCAASGKRSAGSGRVGPGAQPTGGPITIRTPADVLLVLGVLAGVLALVAITVAGEETMFRGLIQTQAGQRYGLGIGLLLAMALFGLRHLPADIFYGQAWHATPQMWLSRQAQLYALALALGLVRHYGKSTFSSAIMHGLIYITALFGYVFPGAGAKIGS